MAQHRANQILAGADWRKSYAITTEQLGEAYADALKALLKRWPRLDLEDPRAELEREW